MEIGNNDLDEIDDFGLDSSPTLESEELTEETKEENREENREDDFVEALLKSRGIEDMSKIKFENDEGSVEERNWNDLSNEEKFNILNSTEHDSDNDLDDSEVLLINSIRESGLTPAEYLQKLQSDGINSYILNSQTVQYEVDQMNDDELFIYDYMSRFGDVTEEEAREALDRAKSNETLFAKQIGAIRKEYKDAEDENLKQALIEEETYAQERYNQFANQIAEQIDNLSEFSGYDLNMDDDDKQMLYDFITGVDGAGVNYFTKALSDPKILVKVAWLTLNGELMIADITNYFLKEISNVRKESYNKGRTESKDKSNVVYKNKQVVSNNDVYDDLDNF